MAVTGLTYNAQHSLDTGNTTPHGMTRVASEAAARRLWIANNSDDQIYKYSDAVAYNTKVALPSGITQPRGFAYDTRRDEVACLEKTGYIYRITPATGVSPGRHSLNTGNTTGEGILYFESLDEFWVVDESDDQFYRYRGDTGAYIGTLTLNSGNTDARGACFVAGEAWVLNGSDKRVYRYDSTGSYLGRFDLNSAHQTPRAMAKVGSKLFVADNGNDKIFDYTITGSPIIAAIASPLNFVVDTAIDFKVRVDLATEVEMEADWEGLYYNWDVNAGELHLEGTPKSLTTGENYTIKATAADASTTTATGTYNVTTPAPIITRPTGTVKFVKGKAANLLIPVSNNPIQVNVKGLIIGADHEPEDTGIRIGGNPIPADANFTLTSGTFDVEARNTGGVDTENDIPFDLLTTAPQLSGLSYNSSTRTLSWTKATDARSYAWRIGATGDWTDVGDVSSYTFSATDAPATGSAIYVRVNQAWVGDTVSFLVPLSEITADRVQLTSGKNYFGLVRVSDTNWWALNYTDRRIEKWVNGSEITTNRVQLTSGKNYQGIVRVSDTNWWALNAIDRRIENWVNGSEITTNRVQLTSVNIYFGLVRISDTNWWTLNNLNRRIENWVNGSEITTNRVQLTSGKNYTGIVRVSDTNWWALNYTDKRIEKWVNGSEITTNRVQLTSGKNYTGIVRVSDTNWWALNNTDNRIEHWA